MRLWSLHPKYLDPKGLVAVWREGLLAQAVLRGATRGYRNHPQLERFTKHATPLAAIASYLEVVQAEAESRTYVFDKGRIDPARTLVTMLVTSGQMEYEWAHLLAKLSLRSPVLYERWRSTKAPDAHPLFSVCAGEVEPWERR